MTCNVLTSMFKVVVLLIEGLKHIPKYGRSKGNVMLGVPCYLKPCIEEYGNKLRNQENKNTEAKY